MSKRPKLPKAPMPIGARTLALSQARAHAQNAQHLASLITTPTNAGMVLAYLVNAGLAIELFFKTFMIAGRGGQVTEEHDLAKLLSEFPPFLRNSFNEAYARHPTASVANIKLVALKISPDVPDRPTQRAPSERYDTFDNAIAAISRVFVDARYFFEQLSLPDWAIFAYPTDAISGILQALEVTYQKFESGAFAGEA